MAKLAAVSRRLVDETWEAVFASCDVDQLDEICEELANAFQVIISQCASVGREIGGSTGNEQIGILGSGLVGEWRELREKGEKANKLFQYNNLPCM